MERLLTCFAALSLGACATTAVAPPSNEDGTVRVREDVDTCNAQGGQRFVGERATQEVGTRLLAATDSRTLRWVPPDTLVTADYRYGRLTVSYGADYVITRVSCG